MAERSNAAVLKTVEGQLSGGSNPSLCAKKVFIKKKRTPMHHQSSFFLFGGLVRVKYAPRTPSIFRAPENILFVKRFLGKRKGRLIGQTVAIATVDDIALP